ACV
ncbi:hypothetical protein D043_3116B, partial [Vibrio parahaemolyticus EKP-021]